VTCPECGGKTAGVREGVCLDCWYSSEDRPKPVRDRFSKLKRLRELGVRAYAYSSQNTHDLVTALEEFEALEGSSNGTENEPDESETSSNFEELVGVTVAGRILSYRDLGGSAFAHIGDGKGRLQIHLKKNLLGATEAEVMKLLDLGDWISVSGDIFRTQRGEVTVRVNTLTLLAKSLRPLPFGKEEVTNKGERTVHGGFQDTESRYRQRYADLAVNPQVREIFRVRAQTISALRRWLDGHGFLEVETPILQPRYGGALAQPFITHHNTLDQRMYLRIADELYLKRLIVGNMDRVYEIGHDFRNEGIDRTHNPEFTMLELYYAYADYEDVMELTETMISEVALKICGTTQLEYNGQQIDLAAPWKRVRWADAFEDATGLDPVEADDTALQARAHELGRTDAKDLSRIQLFDFLFSRLVEDHVVDPLLICDLPIEMSPLAKPKRGNPAYAERFEAVVGGFELVNAFSELNDPMDQWARFAAQEVLRDAGDEDAMSIDEDYVRALEYGLPPTGGFGMGVDRLVMLLTGETTVREVVLFPMLRADEGS
jgi:lysyl-tRNA synthetase class 2